MLAKIDNTVASDHLNFIRGVAAIAVLAAHVRYTFYLGYQEIHESDRLQQAFYTLTAFGHDAVVIFFVMSGLLISSSVIKDCRGGRWSFKKYLTIRCVRLYMVLIPGLLLTLLWDWWGLRLFGDSAIYNGATELWQSNTIEVRERLTLATFLGNLFYLQTIAVQPFGSNEALWSLSNEFWYYCMFPCIWVALWYTPVSRVQRLSLLLTVALLMAMLGTQIVSYFPIWLLGTAVSLLPLSSYISRRPRLTAAILAATFAGCVLLTHWRQFRATLGESVLALDYLNAVCFCALLYAVLHCRQPSANGKYASVSRTIADFSFTLYVIHLPLLVLIRAWLAPNRAWFPDALHVALGAIIGILVVSYAWFVASLTEAQTEDVRDLLLK